MKKSFKQFVSESLPSGFTKTVSGDIRNMHTGRTSSTMSGHNAGEPSKSDQIDFHNSEIQRLKSQPKHYKSHVAYHEKKIKQLSK